MSQTYLNEIQMINYYLEMINNLSHNNRL